MSNALCVCLAGDSPPFLKFLVYKNPLGGIVLLSWITKSFSIASIVGISSLLGTSTFYGDALDGDFAWTGTSNDTLDAQLVVHGQVFRPNGTIAFNDQKEETLVPWSNNPLVVETSNLNVGCGGYVSHDGYAEIQSDLVGNSWQVDDSQSYFVPCEA